MVNFGSNILDNKDSLVIFAGAGCSMAPPSSLPRWNDLNDAILNALWDRLEQYGLNNRFRKKILLTIKQKRTENVFPPDYQAQRMVERAGLRYFQLLSAVDSDSYNVGQYYTALLAKAGLVKAVVTTNFDRNFERAFGEANLPFRSYFDEDGFEQLAFQPSQVIPIIKIHGCCSSPASMVDTRKQRLKGRAKALENVLLKLLQNHHFIFAGFSGQDFDYNKNYLGLRDAVSTAKGFTFLHLPGDPIRESVSELINFYGEQKASSFACDPAEYLAGLLKMLNDHFDPFEALNPINISISDRLKAKINSIESIDAINMLTGLAESYGDEKSARYLYDKVWRERSDSDYHDEEALSRFLLNHGRSFVFNFQDKKERAQSVGIEILHSSSHPLKNLEELFTNPAKINLKHSKNRSPETLALIGLEVRYSPIIGQKNGLFKLSRFSFPGTADC